MIFGVSNEVWLSAIAALVTVAGITQTILTAYLQLLTKRELRERGEKIDQTLGEATVRRNEIADMLSVKVDNK